MSLFVYSCSKFTVHIRLFHSTATEDEIIVEYYNPLSNMDSIEISEEYWVKYKHETQNMQQSIEKVTASIF